MPDPDLISPLRSIHGLREADVAALTQAVAALDGSWSVERHEGYDGDLTVLIMPRDESRETFVVSRNADGVSLATNVGDDYRTIGIFASIGDVMQVVRSRHPAPPSDKTA
jgi:hypothetical protein